MEEGTLTSLVHGREIQDFGADFLFGVEVEASGWLGGLGFPVDDVK